MTHATAIRKDRDDRIVERAEEIADQRYHRDFGDLCPHLQMEVWLEAEHDIIDSDASIPEPDRTEFWDALEMERRLGK